jgi:hypothetical protein
MSKAYKYRKSLSPDKDDSTPLAPRIPVILIGKEEAMENIALIDSGATDTSIPKLIAEILGLRFGKKIQIRTPGGEISGYGSEVTVGVLMEHDRLVKIKVPCHILEDFDEIVLGRAGFFNAFEITFCEAKREVRLKHLQAK